jgi:hypothetical protein
MLQDSGPRSTSWRPEAVPDPWTNLGGVAPRVRPSSLPVHAAWVSLVTSVLLALASAVPVRHVRSSLRGRVRALRRAYHAQIDGRATSPVSVEPDERFDPRE